MSSSCPSLFQGDCGKPGPPGSSGRPGAEVGTGDSARCLWTASGLCRVWDTGTPRCSLAQWLPSLLGLLGEVVPNTTHLDLLLPLKSCFPPYRLLGH